MAIKIEKTPEEWIIIAEALARRRKIRMSSGPRHRSIRSSATRSSAIVSTLKLTG